MYGGGFLELKDRIRAVRKAKSFRSQSKFAEFLGTTRPAIAKYESGDVTPNDIFIQLLCTKLNVNEEWIRTGDGEMFEALDRDGTIIAWAAKVARDDFDNEFIKKFAIMMATLTEKEWKLLETKMCWLVESKKD